jgi:hypothetical protein
MWSWILLIIGVIFAVFGIGGTAKMESDTFGGIVIFAGAGVILIILGVLGMSMGI